MEQARSWGWLDQGAGARQPDAGGRRRRPSRWEKRCLRGARKGEGDASLGMRLAGEQAAKRLGMLGAS